MGIFGALTTSVAGMRAQSFALENISGNIANSQTTAFKRMDTSFLDLIPDSSANRQLAGSVTSMSRNTNNVQGDVQAASISTFMAINGDGFFYVQKPAGVSDNNPIFDGVDMFTRRGDFQMDKSGHLVNGAGYYLMGIPVDPTTGNPAGDSPQVLKFQSDFLPAQQTSRIDYRANLAGYPLTNNHDKAVPGSELLDASLIGDAQITGADSKLFIDSSIAGGAVTAYDVSGAPVQLQMRWAKTDSVTSGGTDTWNLYYQIDGNATGTGVSWQQAGGDFVFGPNMQLDPPIASLTLTAPTVGGVTLGDITLNFGTGGITQFADSNGNVKVNQIEQNGYPAGQLQSVSVNENGRVVGNYSNGRNLDLAAIQLASFNGANFLERVDGGAFKITDASGPPLANASGRIIGSSLEGSNVDIGDEFTKLIVTQQAYSANTRVITTSNQMVQDLLNMLR